jgi:hypothetical protein
MALGFLTPGAGVAAGILCLAGIALPDLATSGGPRGAAAAALLATLSAAVALVGPGAFSVDARLFGRREIILPRASRRFPPD